MSDDGVVARADRDHAAAYAARYSNRDLVKPLQPCRKIMDEHASAREAGYSRTQIQNIVNGVVPPGQELLDEQMELAFAHLGRQMT